MNKTLFFPFISLFLIISLLGVEQPITYVYSHGLGATGVNAIHYVKGHSLDNVKAQATSISMATDKTSNTIQHISLTLNNSTPFYILDTPIHHFNYPYAPDISVNIAGGIVTMQNGVKYPKRVSMGQMNEIRALDDEIHKLNSDTVLFGHSLGAATVITYLATCQPLTVKAVILEAPFDTVETVVNNKAGIFSWTGIGSLVRGFAYPGYDSSGIKPLHCISRLNKDIPIIFIHSKKDTLIPVASSRNLYCELKKAGHTKVHLFELSQAGHNNATTSPDADDYQHVVHAFYKKYGLPHDALCAQVGESLLAKTQPSITEVKTRR